MPLKVLPSIANVPSVRRAPRCRLDSRPRAPPVPPLGAEHHQVQGVDRFHLDPGRAAPARAVDRVRAPCTTTPSWPRASASAAKRRAASRAAASPGSVDDQPAYPQRLGRHPGQFARAVRAPAGEQVAAVEGEQVEEDRGERQRRLCALDVEAGADPAGRLLERPRPARRAERDDLAVQHGLRRGSARAAGATSGSRSVISSRVRVKTRTGPRRPGGPGRGCRRASPPRRTGRAGPAPRRRPSRCAPASAAPGGPPPAGSRPAPPGRRRAAPRRPRRASRRASPRGGRRRASAPHGGGQALDGKRVQRALAQLAADQPDQEVLFARRWPPTSARPAVPCAAACAPLPETARDPVERRVRLGTVSVGRRRAAGGRRRAAPADADAALRQPAREVGDDDGRLVRLRVRGTARRAAPIFSVRAEVAATSCDMWATSASSMGTILADGGCRWAQGARWPAAVPVIDLRPQSRLSSPSRNSSVSEGGFAIAHSRSMTTM